jgi:glycosyltransferase involved in cell wall biosynthesis
MIKSTIYNSLQTIQKSTLSVVLATRNEEKNIADCLDSVKNIADEIIVYDEYSTDKTREIAKRYGARVFKFKHKRNFHETKQRAINKASGKWILQLDADERVGKRLSEEIRSVINGKHISFLKGTLDKKESDKKQKLFKRHQKLLEQRDEIIFEVSENPDVYFVPRINYFLGEPLIHGGVYPDGVIRLFKKGKAYLPAKSVHEVMKASGSVGWLFNDLEHNESPTLKRYFSRMKLYTDYNAGEIKSKYIHKGNVWLLAYFVFLKPNTVFLNLYFRHKGFLDGYRGFLWALFSSWHFPVAYYKYWKLVRMKV